MFPHIEKHRIYPKTFLHRVIFQLNYAAEISDKYEVFKSFFENSYGLDLDKDQFEILRITSLRISDNKSGISIKFSDGFFQIKIEKPGYKSFKDSMEHFVSSFSSLLKTVGATVERISIKKINMWICEERKETPYQAISRFLNHEIIEKWKSNFDKDPQITPTILINDSDDDINMMYSFGFLNEDSSDEGSYPRVILDTEGVLDKSGINPDDVLEHSIKINSLLYDAYHWAVKSDVIKLMTEE